MIISEKIKEKRLKHNWTQEELAQMLNVSRPAVSSWEVGRNYPDLETIITMSELFDISLDDLLKGDKEVVEQISDDTKTRKDQSKKIRWLVITIIVLISFGGIFGYRSIRNIDISSDNQIQLVTVLNNGDIKVNTSIPFYRSMSSYMSSKDTESSVIEITLGYSFDWSFKHKESIVIPYDKEFFNGIDTLHIVSPDGEVLLSIPLDEKKN